MRQIPATEPIVYVRSMCDRLDSRIHRETQVRTVTLDGRYLTSLTDLQRRYFLKDLFELADAQEPGKTWEIRVKGQHYAS